MNRNVPVELEFVLRVARKVRPKPNSDVRIDYSKWSEAALACPMALIDEFYSHRPYQCRVCKRACVFSAEDQKHALEVLKKPLQSAPSMCEECHAIRVGLEREQRACFAKWRIAKQNLQGNPTFLTRWLEILETLPRYGIRADSGKITQLRRLLHATRPRS
ncbi:hypothetical protein C7S18_22880 [Ahniella affigens]|uniref:Probable zinc-binding domain-containing protein n=1 Tax=Ahniella affigens TaxID=2021234 RepID=A0A2P1PYB7_9GAMM|nr:zinc-ribbon domain containing protein [Ahniella affigens]AVP99845.1 hypothetical protein C7S18_22880 [Ahniella affigens]